MLCVKKAHQREASTTPKYRLLILKLEMVKMKVDAAVSRTTSSVKITNQIDCL